MDLINKYLSEENKDTGWKSASKDRKDQYGNPVKTANVAKSLARKAMKSAVADLKKGPEAGKRQVEDVKQIDELEKSTLDSYADKAEKDIKAKKDEFKAQGGQMRKKSQRDLDAKITKRYQGLFTAQRKAGLPLGFKEEVEELEELKQDTLTKYITRARFSSDPKRRMGAQRAMVKVGQKPKEEKPVKTEEVESIEEISKDTLKSYTDKSMKDAETKKKQGSAYERLVPSDSDYAKTFYKKSTKRLAGASKAMSRLATEENKAYKAQDKESIRTTGMNLNQRAKMYDDIQKKLKDQEAEYRKQGILPPKNEEVELDESGGDVVWKKGNDHIEKYGDEKFALYKDGKKTKYYKSVGDAKAALSEGKYGSFRVRTTSGTFGGPKLPRRSYVPQGDQDPRSGLPLGFSNPPEKSEKPENDQGKRLDKVRKAMSSSR